MQDFFKSLSNAFLPLLLILLGGAFLLAYTNAEPLEPQPKGMMIGGVMLMLVGILALPPVLTRLGRTMSIVVMMAGMVVSVWLAFLNFDTVDEEMVFLENQKRYQETTVQRLKDIRIAQDEYVKAHGRYASDFDTLLAFISEPVLAIPYQAGGAFLDTMTLAEATRMGRILNRAQAEVKAAEMEISMEKFEKRITANKVPYAIRDTSFSSVFDLFFAPELRKKKNLAPLTIEELPYAPFSGLKFLLSTGEIDQGGIKLPTVLVKDPAPFGREGLKIDTLRFGSLSESHTNGNWGSK